MGEPMRIKIYQVDAFTEKVFAGNPAAVCPLEEWLDDEMLQAIAMENNLSETAFFVPEGEGYRLRWFTPAMEVDLCGHATLATAHALFEVLGYAKPEIVFETRSGKLTVGRDGDHLRMDFPTQPPQPCEATRALREGLKREPVEVLAADDFVAVYEKEEDVRSLTPDFRVLKELDIRGVIATAPGDEVDFVSRVFAPGAGIDEDPVTGSAHCELAPYWGQRLGKIRMQARQISQRGGEVVCELAGDRVLLYGQAVLYMEGEVRL